MSVELAHLMVRVAAILLGDPNKKFSKKDEFRYGNKGSLAVDLKAGTFYDHENNVGGGVLDLIRRECPGEDPMAWLREQTLIDDNTVVATFDYQDENGKLLFQVCRTTAKRFYQRQPNGTGWINGIKGVRRVVYRLPELLAETGVVFIPEGEKHVDRLRAWGLRATCNPMGAGKWRPEFASILKDADVVILPDNDDAGRGHAENIAESLLGIAGRVRVLPLPDLKEKGDIIDWMQAGGTKEQFLDLVATAKDWAPPEKPRSACAGDRPLIEVVPGQLSAIADRGEATLISASVPFYQRSGELVRPVIVTVEASDDRKTVVAQLQQVDTTYMRDMLCRVADWARYDKRTKKWQQIDPPKGDGGHHPRASG
jgi:putative DNA primase/helicase